MNIASFFLLTVFAAQEIISPLPDSQTDLLVFVKTDRPKITFADLNVKSKTPDAVPVVPNNTEYSDVSLSNPPEKNVSEKKPKDHYPALKKNSYIIALIGDSMVDTLGPGIPHLQSALNQKYPGISFTLHNYGVGATDIEYGIKRMTNDYDYLGKRIPSLLSVNPDIVVIESFGYNPFPIENGGLNRHWLALALATDTIRSQLPQSKIIIAATIAPNSNVFGDGAPGISFTPEDKISRTSVIKQYLESTVKFSQSQGLPLANAYNPSLDNTGEGKLKYINAGDHIHYSDAGRQLFAVKLAETIHAYHLLE